MVAIKHLDSGYSVELTQDEYDGLIPRVKEKYKITGTTEINTPAELESSSN